jgi:peptidylprolyl isomerase domain and WD repeat-containing protein 1
MNISLAAAQLLTMASSPLEQRDQDSAGNKRDHLDDDSLPNEETLEPDKKKPRKVFSHPDIPTTSHYHVSWMHASIVTSAAVSVKYGYVLTGSADGIVKFWKRLNIESKQEKDNATSTRETAAASLQQHACLEFVKSFTAHTKAVLALAMDLEGDACVSVGADGWLKFYDVSTFDVSTMIYLGKENSNSTNQPRRLGHACCWLQDPVTCIHAVAVSSADTGEIYICDAHQLLQVLTLHGSNPVTCLVAIPGRYCVMSTDAKGIVEIWSTASNSTPSLSSSTANDRENFGDEEAANVASRSDAVLSIGGPCTASRNGITYTSKLDTDLYELVRKKTFCLAAAATSNHVALYGADQKIRILEHSSGKLLVTFVERPKVYDQTFGLHGIDAMEYGRRAALDREMMANMLSNSSSSPSSQQNMTIQFDPSGKYLLIPTVMGIKVLDWDRRKLLGWIGQADASQWRFISLCLAPGDAKMDQQILLARNASTKTSAGIEAAANEDQATVIKSDALVIALAHDKRRFYVFSHVDPVLDPDAPDDIVARRDIWNEAPTVDDRLYHSDVHSKADSSKTANKAILRTTMGDIHIQLFASQVPKTIENFVGHSRAGYYDGVIFHRVIKGFMLQVSNCLYENDCCGRISLSHCSARF